MSTGLTPTSSAVGMFEPVTMTRSAVAAAPVVGTTFPCASRATGAWAPGGGEGEGEGPCAGRLDTMAKKIASRTAPLRNNPHSGSWTLFIYLFSLIRRILKTPASVQCFFYIIFLFARMPSIISTTTNQRRRHSEYSWCSMLFGGAPRSRDDVLNFVLLLAPCS